MISDDSRKDNNIRILKAPKKLRSIRKRSAIGNFIENQLPPRMGVEKTDCILPLISPRENESSYDPLGDRILFASPQPGFRKKVTFLDQKENKNLAQVFLYEKGSHLEARTKRSRSNQGNMMPRSTKIKLQKIYSSYDLSKEENKNESENNKIENGHKIRLKVIKPKTKLSSQIQKEGERAPGCEACFIF